jgi:hypothetical protein
MSIKPLSSFLRNVLLADAATCAAAGLLMALGAQPLQELLALPAPLLRYAGLGLLPFAAALVYLSQKPAAPAGAVLAVIAGNAAWVAASVLILAAGVIEPNRLGVAFVLAQAAAVAVLAEMEWVGLRRSAALAA